ncbi:MAG: DUF3604 domain-containing protein [Myxococcota bacterium]|nr:DUF3604 domain-containing protein [Myxococcota bacterium]
MAARILIIIAVLVALAFGGVWLLGTGWLGTDYGAGIPTAGPIPDAVLSERGATQQRAAERVGVAAPKQILFGDLHVHSTYSLDAFLMSLSIAGGDGVYPVSDACDFARHCSALDFWSINDHALGLTPERWAETKEAIRQCNAVAGDDSNPDTTAFLGWEWTQMGTTAGNHYGHKNVILRHLDEARTPARPIAAAPPPAAADRAGFRPSTLALGLLPVARPTAESLDLVRYFQELLAVPVCPVDLPVRELPNDCREQAATPQELFAKLDDWGHESLVIPHGTAWGYYTPLGSNWDKQLTRRFHDPARQTLVEVFSGHGNSEEYRAYREIEVAPDGTRSCPGAQPGYLPSCWRAGEIILERCRQAGEDPELCDARSAEARQNYVDADVSGYLTVPGATLEDWLDAGQCRDCRLPAFNQRPRSSVQYMMALRNFDEPDPTRFRFGFIASSDNHSSRPGTGYKEYDRSVMTEARFDQFGNTIFGAVPEQEPLPRSEPFDPSQSTIGFFGIRESERQASFFYTGGLVAAHAAGRGRDAIWEALERREVYGTSGPRILLWFDLVDSGGGAPVPMGSDVEMAQTPAFEVRAVGSLEQQPGCPDFSQGELSPERFERLCRGECYHPSDSRRKISRIEVIRIRPRVHADENIAELIEDPWLSLPCAPDPAGCQVRFRDEDFPGARRDTLYYVRAIEEPSMAVNADTLRCETDANGNCVRIRPCSEVADSDDCLAESEELAWSSPIFIDYRPDPASP